MKVRTSREIVGRFDEHFESRNVEMDDQLDSERWVSVSDILERMRSARISKGYKDNYYAIEKELEVNLR